VTHTDPEPERLAYQLAHTEHVMRRALDRVLRPHGLTLLGWAALSQIARDPEISGAELTRRIFVSQQAISKLLARLVELGLAVHTARPGRLRVQDYRATERGCEVATQCDHAVMAVERALRDHLGPTETDLVMRRLEQCRQLLSQMG